MNTRNVKKHMLCPTLPRLASAVLALSAILPAATLAEADKKEGLAQLERTRIGVVEAAKGLSETQLRFKPASIAGL